MSKDLYDVLGVSRNASKDEIRKAYRAKAKELHPDLKPGDKEAEEEFKQVSAAYAILGKEDQRKRYDKGEIDESGAERPEHQFYRRYADADEGGRYSSSAGYEDFADMGDVFSDLFGQRGAGRARAREFRMSGGDVYYNLEVDFLDAVRGARQRLTMPDGSALDVTIPAGMRDGQVMRLKGKGQPGLGGGKPGDALIEISVRPHPVFSREGDDILIELPISLDEAILGGKVEVPTIDGRVNMSIPKGAQNGQVLRLRAKGVAGSRGAKGGTGDQLVRLELRMPEQPDPELEAFIGEWRKTHGYDARAAFREKAT